MDDVGEQVSPLAKLAEYRDGLACELAENLAVGGTIRDASTEIDAELADENHAAVSEAVDQIVANLRSLTEDSVRDLSQVAAVEIPGQSPGRSRGGFGLISIPPYPAVVDPASITRREPSDDETEYEVETEYDDALTEACRALVSDRAWHLRHLVEHAAELVDAIIGCAHAGDEPSAIEYLRQRDEVIDRLEKAFKLWEYALAGQMSGPAGPSEEITAFTRWLDNATRQQ